MKKRKIFLWVFVGLTVAMLTVVMSPRLLAQNSGDERTNESYLQESLDEEIIETLPVEDYPKEEVEQPPEEENTLGKEEENAGNTGDGAIAGDELQQEDPLWLEEDSSSEVLDEEESEEPVTRNTGTWNTVPWTFDPATATVTLRGGNAGSHTNSPWHGASTIRPVVKKIIFTDTVRFPNGSTENIFRSLPLLEEIEGLRFLDMTNVTNGLGMFAQTPSLKEVDISMWNNTQLTTINLMFAESGVESVYANGLDVSNLKSMVGIFSRTTNLKKVEISEWDTSNVENFQSLFVRSSIENIDFADWDTSNGTNMAEMFSYATNIKEIDIAKWNTSKVERFELMFEVARSLEKVDVSEWDTSSAVSMRRMFAETPRLSEIDVSNWDTSNVTDMHSLFNTTGAKVLDVSNWDTSKVTNMRSTFQGFVGTELNLSNWDTRNVNEMPNMFVNANNLATLSLGSQTILNETVDLSDVPVEENYIGKWLYSRNAAGIEPVDSPQLYTSLELVTQYDGSKPGTYIWAEWGAPVTVYYQDAEGNTLAPSETLTGIKTISYSTKEHFQEIENYELIRVDGNETGHFTAEPQEVIYIYELIGELTIVSVPNLEFGQHKITNRTQELLPDIQTPLVVENVNNSNRRTAWKLTVRQTQAFTNGQDSLGNILYFIKNGNEQNITTSDVLVEERSKEEAIKGDAIENVSDKWDENNGIKVIVPVEQQKIGDYQATLRWQLANVP